MVNYKGIYTLGFQNVGHINRVSALMGFSRKNIYGVSLGQKKVAVNQPVR